MPAFKTPFFGSAYASRSTNLADQSCINVYPEIVETRSGKNVGAFYGCPGLDLKCTAGGGPIQNTHVMAGTLYAISGNQVYSISQAFTPTLIGPIDASSAVPSMIDNGKQLVIFTAQAGYLLPGGQPLTGGTVSNGGSEYNVGDTVNLVPIGGNFSATAIITVNAIGNYVLTGGFITAPGSGYAVGNTITLAPVGGAQVTPAVLTVAAVASGAVTAVTVTAGGAFSAVPTGFTQASTSGSGIGFTFGSLIFAGGAVTAFTVTEPGAFNPLPTSLAQVSTSGSGQGLIITSPTFGVFVPIYTLTLPFTPSGAYTIAATQSDGFGLIDQPGTYTIWQSDELDLSQWDGLNFASASGDPDNIIALRQQHREIYIIKEHDTEIWVNVGSPGFAFARLTNVFIEVGIWAQNSLSSLGETLIFLARNKQGENVVVQMQGYNPIRISTHAIEHAIQQYPTTTDAIGMTYQQEGHQFYMLTFPSGNATWVYDATASSQVGVPMWHQRAAFAGGLFSRHWANSSIAAYGFNLVGDYLSGNIYAFNLDQELDNGTQRKWLRSWRALPQPTIDPVRFSQLSIDMQTGIGVPINTAPQIVLEWSDDGGHNWSQQIVTAVGVQGKTAQRVIFRRLGSTRRNSGLDRIFRLSSSDQFPTALIGADLK